MTRASTIAALCLTAIGFGYTPANANGVQCPDGSYRDDAKWCPVAPQPQPAPGAVGVGVGIGTGIGVGTGTGIGHGGAGGAGGGGGQGGGGGTATATGGTSFGGNQSVNVQQGGVSIRNRAAASAAIAAPLPGAGFPNCFGDPNSSGSFSAAFGNIFAGASASSHKASNVCAVYEIGGPELALRYLQRMDPSMPRSITIDVPVRVTCPASHPIYVSGKGCRK